MTDINDLDRHIGAYVDLSEGEHGAAGFLVDVSDDVKYEPRPVRWVALDWGQGWPVSADTAITVLAEPPAGEHLPESVRNPIQVMHEAMHAESECADRSHCPEAASARTALKAFRRWQERQSEQYWVHTYVNRVKGGLNDADFTSNFIRDARSEGAPPHIIERMQSLVDWHEKGAK